MTLTLELPPDVEAALAEDARRKGTTPEELALDNLRRSYIPPAIAAGTAREDPTLSIFAQWEADYATDDPEELARRQREGDELMEALATNPRLSFDGRTDFSDLLAMDDDADDKRQEKAA